MDKILVTGASGLLGQSLLEQLSTLSIPVIAIIHQNTLEKGYDHIDIITGDILDVGFVEEVMVGITQVYHCAGMVSFAPADVQQLYKLNVEGTANVVNAAIAAGVRKMVHVSSVAAIGRLRHNQLVTETMQWSQTTSNSKYGHSKYLGEMEVWRAHAEGLDVVIVNPVIILGAGNWNSGSTKIFKSVYDEFPWYTTGVTGFVDAADVAKAMLMLMGSNISGERFIISAENVSYESVLKQIAKAFGKKQPYKKVTHFLAKVIWRLEAVKSFFTGTKPLITEETTATAMATVHFDNSKLLAALPQFSYQPLAKSIITICGQLQQKFNRH